jgi:hypothetical protein
MRVLVDDIRAIDADIIVRNFKSSILLADKLDFADVDLLLDHDLGEEKTGYNFINYLIEIGNLPKLVTIVSSNPVGRDNIIRALENEGYVRKHGDFHRCS